MEVSAMKCPVCGKKVASIEISEQVWHVVQFNEDGTFRFYKDVEYEPIGMMFRHEDPDDDLCFLEPEHEFHDPLVCYFFNIEKQPPEEIAHLFS
jgi:hypothetical protein